MGQVIKTHGNAGEIRVQCTKKIKFNEWAFLEFRGKPVPFYISQQRQVQPDEYLLKLKSIDSVELAESLIGRNLLWPGKSRKTRSDSDVADLIGFLLIDEELGEIGLITNLEEYPSQLMAFIDYKGKQIMLPLPEEIITDINIRSKKIKVNLPEGILDIN